MMGRKGGAGSAIDWLRKQSAESAPAVVTIAASIF